MRTHIRWLGANTLFVVFFATSMLAQIPPGESEESIRGRYKYFLKKRSDPQGNFDMNAILRAKEQLDVKFNKALSRSPMDAGIGNWEWLGPGNIGGRIKAILIHPTNPNLMWIGSPGGGIWKTTDAGAWWTPVDDFLPMMNVVTLAMDPTNDQIMYAGTGEFEYFGQTANGRSITGGGIFKSTNGGQSWFQLPSTNNSNFQYVSRIAHHPTRSNCLLAATFTGVYKSYDGGVSWIASTGEFGVGRDIQIHPTDTTKVLLGTTTDIFLSTNGGAAFTRQSTGLPGKIPNWQVRHEVAFAPSDPNYMYTSIALSKGVIWRSTDGGTNWNYQNTASTESTSANWYTNAIWVSPTDPNFLIAGGTEGCFRSTDGGVNFTLISDWGAYHNGSSANSAHGDEQTFVAHPGFNGTANRIFFAGNDGGIQRASDIATVSKYSGWTNLANNLGITQFYAGAAAPDGSVIVGGTQDLSFMKYTPAGGPQGWWNPYTGDGGFCAVDFDNPARVYSEYQWLDVARSDNGGNSFASKITGLTDAKNGASTLFISPLVMDPNNSSTLLVGSMRIWKTTNRGDNWTQIRSSISSNPMCSAIDFSKSNTQVIWIGYDNGVVSRSTDAGSSWIDVVTPAPNNFVTDIAINPAASNEVIVTLGGYDTNSVWLTSNSGSSWVKRIGTGSNRLPAVQVNTIRYHPLEPNWIYVGTDLGVFASEDKGINWNITPRYQNNEGPVNTVVEELFWQGTSYLIAATHGRGMWRCKPLPIVYVDLNYVGTEDGSEFQPYNTVQEAVDAYGPGALVSIKAGTYDEPVLNINKRGMIRSTNGVVRIK